MSNAITHVTTLRTALADAVCHASTGALGTGWQLIIYSGTAPANAQAALSGNVAIASLGVSAATAAFGAASSGVSTVSTLPPADTNAVGGTASFFRLCTSAGVTAQKVQGLCGTSGSDLNLNSLTIASGANVSLNAGGTYTAPL